MVTLVTKHETKVYTYRSILFLLKQIAQQCLTVLRFVLSKIPTNKASTSLQYFKIFTKSKMWPSSCKGLNIISVFLSLQLKFIQCKAAPSASIPELLATSESCLVQVIYDKIGDDLLQPVSSLNLHPIFLIPSKLFGNRVIPAIDLRGIRDSECKISFIVYEYYFPGNLNLLQPNPGFWMEAADYQFKTTINALSNPHAHKNVYKILISGLKTVKLQKIFEYPYFASTRHTCNLGILFIARNQTLNLCVQPIGSSSKNIFTMRCKQPGNGNIAKLFRDLHSIPILWRLDSYTRMHIEESYHEDIDFDKLTFYANPFNRLQNFLFINIYFSPCFVKPTQAYIFILTKTPTVWQGWGFRTWIVRRQCMVKSGTQPRDM